MKIEAFSEETRGEKAHLNIAGALRKLELSAGGRSVLMFEHGALQIKMSMPRGPNGEKIDLQQPHTRDELYVVAQGTGTFFDGETRRVFQAGDLIFAAAGHPHRFEDFTDDFAVWVMFYGPEGGEGIGG